jgi:predicted Zn-dependent peptidase
MHEAAFGENSPLGQSFFANSLDSLEASDVLSYRAANYTTGNIVATASGIPHATFKAMMECNLHDLPVQPSSVPASPYMGGDIKVRTSTSGLSHLGLGFPIPVGEEQVYCVLFGILSSNLADKAPKGSLKPFFNNYSTGGIMGFYASGSAMEAAGILETVVAEVKDCQRVTSIDGMRAKSRLNMALSLNESSSITCALLHGHSSDFSKVTVAAVSAAASAILKANPSYVVSGTTSGTPSIASINKLMK